MKYERFIHLKLNKILKEKNIEPKDLYNMIYPNDKIPNNMTGQALRDKTRNICNWINGVNTPPVDRIIDICNCLDCDLDYFFTNMEETTHNIEYISSITKLSEKSINNLANSTPYEKEILDLLLNEGYFRDICFAIYKYMQTFYKEIKIIDDKTDNEEITENEKMEIAEYRATKHFSRLLVDKLANNSKMQNINKSEHYLETLSKYVRSEDFKNEIQEINL